MPAKARADKWRAERPKIFRAGLVVNAGHDLNLRNPPSVMEMPDQREVSIGHEFTVDTLIMGFEAAIAAYRAFLEA
jgi:pyridoxine 5-phosphate synthase